MSQENVDLVRSIYASWERGDYDSAEWAYADIEYAVVDGPAPNRVMGLADMASTWREVMGTYEGFRAVAREYREIDTRRVLVLAQFSGRARTSGMQLGRMETRAASLFEMDGGLVRRLTLYWDRDRALADLGLEE